MKVFFTGFMGAFTLQNRAFQLVGMNTHTCNISLIVNVYRLERNDDMRGGIQGEYEQNKRVVYSSHESIYTRALQLVGNKHTCNMRLIVIAYRPERNDDMRGGTQGKHDQPKVFFTVVMGAFTLQKTGIATGGMNTHIQ